MHSRSSVLSSNTSCKTTTIKMDRPYLLLVLQMNWAVTGTGQWTHWLWFSALEDNLWCDALAADKRKTWKTVSKLYKLEIKTLKHYSNNGKFAKFKDFFITIERNFQYVNSIGTDTCYSIYNTVKICHPELHGTV